MQSRNILLTSAVASAILVSGCKSLPPPTPPNPTILSDDAKNSAQRQSEVMNIFEKYALGEHSGIGIGSGYWYEVMEVGFNYVDEKCDRYLHELSSFQRRRDRVHKGITVASGTTTALLTAAEASTASLSVVAALFGFGAQATDIFAGSYLFSVSPGIVYKNVRDAQAAYRTQTALDDQEAFITTRSAAFNRIRGYLALCLPVSIESRIEENLMKTTAVAKKPVPEEAKPGPTTTPPKQAAMTVMERRAAGAAAPMIETVPAE